LGENGKSDGQVDAVDAHFRDDNHWASILTTDSDASVIGGPSNQTQLGKSHEGKNHLWI